MILHANGRTLVYTFFTFSLLAFATLFLYWVLTSDLERENTKFLQDEIAVLQKILQVPQLHAKTHSVLRQEIIIERPITHAYSRILDQNGKIFLETPNMSKAIPIAVFAHILPGGKKTFETQIPDSTDKNYPEYYLLMQGFANQSFNKTGKFTIQVAKNMSTDQQIIADYREALIIVLLLGIIGSTVIGVTITRQGLKPLREMTLSTQRISITQLKEQLNPSSWPIELSTLATAFNHMLDRIEEGFTRLSQFSDDLAEEFGRLSQMIENLLFLARAENPQKTITRSFIDIHSLFNSICEFYGIAAEEQGVTLCYQGDGNFQADPILIRRAISNLVSNALRHTPTGGSIMLSAKTSQDETIEISVSDTGKGIASTYLPHLFERFYRVDAATTQSTGGTGLGLAMVKSIVNLHQGNIRIVSETGKGTTVTMRFMKANQAVI